MAALKRAAEQAKAGRGQIVAAIAEAGVGKSRLFFEFKAENQSGWMVLEAFSVSHGKASAFLPVIDLLWSYFEISSDDDERKRREKINGKILTLDRSLEDALPYLLRAARSERREQPARQMDRADPKAAHARCDQAHPPARVAQPAADGDLRGPALDRRGDAGALESPRRLDRQCEDPAAGQLSSGIFSSVEQQDLSIRSFGSTRSARSRPTRCWLRCSAMAPGWRSSSA